MRSLLPLLFLAGVLGTALSAAPASSPRAPATMKRLPSDAASGRAVSVLVPDGPLVFTPQVFAPRPGGTPAQEVDAALTALAAALAAGGGSLDRVVRLHAYVVDRTPIPAVEAAVAARFAATPVAFTLVVSPLEQAGARVAFEAVAVSSRASSRVEVTPAAAVLPAGGKIFISGQAEKGADPASAVRLTMAGLHRSLAHLGLKGSDVVQVKVFLQPFAEHAAARREVAASFGGGPVPPVVILEWVSDLHTEIELVAAAPGLAVTPGENIAYSWFPWLVKSPRYCNTAHVAPGTPLIFISALQGGDDRDPRTQMKVLFERLGSVLFEAGSSYRNLAKATYYLHDPVARGLLGDIRGVYFDPTRPPAASALQVRDLGYGGRAASIDMVAVPVK